MANQATKCMNLKGVKDVKIFILGITFKEYFLDIRNAKTVDIYHTLEEYSQNITVFDPWANYAAVKHEYGIKLTDKSFDELKGRFDAVILGVSHKEFTNLMSAPSVPTLPRA